MKYDFTTILDRSDCGSLKWDGAKNASTENVPLSTADMEFPVAPEIREAIKKAADDYVLGYTGGTDRFYDAVIGWMERKHNFHVEKEWIVNTPGVVNALGLLVDATTKPGDTVIILTPVYYPFDMAVLAKGRGIVYSELINNNGHYEIDYRDLEEKAKSSKAKALLFCNPHNPVGRVWTFDELKRVADICCDNGVFIIDDEIHHDIIMPGYKHTVMANVSERVKDNIAVCTAPSKTFNIAGLQCSNIIIPNKTIRTKTMACSLFGMQLSLEIFAYTACATAYNKCEKWLEEMIKVVKKNAETVEKFMENNFPEIKVLPLEGTYLQWLDMRNVGLTHVEMKKVLEDAGIYLDNGEIFGIAGRGYQRINLACPTATIEKMLKRFKKALDNVKKDWEENGKSFSQDLKVMDTMADFTYNSLYGENKSFRNTINKKTLLIFARFAECEVTQMLVKALKGIYPILKHSGNDIKVVVNSTVEELKPLQGKCDFELIADPEGKIYDRYHVFEVDGGVKLVTGDKLYEKYVHGNPRKLLETSLFEKLAGSFLGDDSQEESKHRDLQVCAFFVINKNMKVDFSHYCETIADFPNLIELIKKINS